MSYALAAGATIISDAPNEIRRVFRHSGVELPVGEIPNEKPSRDEEIVQEGHEPTPEDKDVDDADVLARMAALEAELMGFESDDDVEEEWLPAGGDGEEAPRVRAPRTLLTPRDDDEHGSEHGSEHNPKNSEGAESRRRRALRRGGPPPRARRRARAAPRRLVRDDVPVVEVPRLGARLDHFPIGRQARRPRRASAFGWRGRTVEGGRGRGRTMGRALRLGIRNALLLRNRETRRQRVHSARRGEAAKEAEHARRRRPAQDDKLITGSRRY